jgi:hypothetical protein
MISGPVKVPQKKAEAGYSAKFGRNIIARLRKGRYMNSI